MIRIRRVILRDGLYLFLLLLFLFVAPIALAAAVPVTPSFPTDSNVTTSDSPTVLSTAHNSASTSLPTPDTTPGPTTIVTATVTLTSNTKIYPWENDARAAVKKLLNLAFETSSKAMGASAAATTLDIKWTDHKYAAAPPEFSFQVTVYGWPGKTGGAWLWGWRPSTFRGSLRLIQSERCPSCHLSSKRFKIVFGMLNDESNTRLVTVENDAVVTAVGTGEIVLLPIPLPALVKRPKIGSGPDVERGGPSAYSGMERGGPSSSRLTTGKKPILKTVYEDGVEDHDQGDIEDNNNKGKGKGKA